LKLDRTVDPGQIGPGRPGQKWGRTVSKALQPMRRTILAGFVALLASFALASPANAAFGLKDLDVSFENQDGTPATQAGSHPFAMVTELAVNTFTTEEGGEVPEGEVRDLTIAQIPGFVGNQTAVPTCSAADFNTRSEGRPACPDATAVGYSATEAEFEVIPPGQGGLFLHVPVYNLAPPPGVAARLGFVVLNVPVTIDVFLNEESPHNLVAKLRNIPQALLFYRSKVTLWGSPASPAHDSLRGDCVGEIAKTSIEPISLGKCPVNINEKAFLTLPRACNGPLETIFGATSWLGDSFEGSALTHDDSEPPTPLGMSDCGGLQFSPTIEAKPTTKAAESSTGLDLSIDVADEGLASPTGRAKADIGKVVLTLPEGMTANPSSAEGLEVCSEADLDQETLASAPGEGCPDASKLGTLEVDTPLLDQSLPGSLFLAKPFENQFGTLIALYLVIKSPGLGILVKQPVKVEPDPVTGRLVSTTEDIPELPFSHFKLHFREGARSPLVSPPSCGEHEVQATITPSSGGAPITTTSAFELISGSGGTPCPQGSPPFDPGFSAGTLNNNAGSHSAFLMRLTRRDGDQDLTKFSASLPPGMVAKIAGVSQCSDAAIASAKGKTGAREKASPSCPSSSQIGRVLAGAGVGSVLTYVPGSLYLAGPYNGAPLSVAAIVPAVAGPFDVGTVVTRVALKIDPRTAKVTVDGAASDPIPHILAGIPLKVRDIRVYADRPDFTLNPTSCDPFSVGANIWGGGTNVFSALDDSPVSRSERFQAADCANLGFKPRLSLKLKGGTKRGDFPALQGEYVPRAGDANLKGLVLRLPPSAFLEQGHFGTICTRVQFAAKSCPAAAVYGKAKAITPLLDQPLEGPVYLRSSDHNLPDFVADLHGLIDVEAVARIDSKKGGIRATFEDVPDAPLTKVIVSMQGGKKGLIVNSRNLCRAKSRANAKLSAHNGKVHSPRPVVEAKCTKKRKGR
jgi:hypothetical protein